MIIIYGRTPSSGSKGSNHGLLSAGFHGCVRAGDCSHHHLISWAHGPLYSGGRGALLGQYLDEKAVWVLKIVLVIGIYDFRLFLGVALSTLVTATYSCLPWPPVDWLRPPIVSRCTKVSLSL